MKELKDKSLAKVRSKSRSCSTSKDAGFSLVGLVLAVGFPLLVIFTGAAPTVVDLVKRAVGGNLPMVGALQAAVDQMPGSRLAAIALLTTANERDRLAAHIQDSAFVSTVFNATFETGCAIAAQVSSAEFIGSTRQIWPQLAGASVVALFLACAIAVVIGRNAARRRRSYEKVIREVSSERKRVEEALHVSDERLRHFFSSSENWYWETDADLRLTAVSNNFAAFLGLSTSAMLGRTRNELQRPADEAAQSVVEALNAVLAGRELFRDFEYSIRAAGGAIRWIKESGTPYLDSNGQFAGYRGVGRDATAQKENEIALERRNHLLSESIGCIASGFSIFDEAGRLVTCNASYLDTYSASRDFIVPGARIEDIVRKGAERGQYKDAIDDIETFVSQRVAQHQHPSGLPIEQQLGDGRCVLVIESRMPCGYVVGTSVDITARKNAERWGHKFSLVIEQSPSSIFIADLEGRIEYANEAFVRDTGYSREEAIGNRLSILMRSGKTPQSTYDSLWQDLREEKTWRGEVCNRRKDGTEYVDSAVITPIYEVDGQVIHYVGIQNDITDKVRLSEELDKYRFHLEELVSSRTTQLAEARDAANAANVAKSAFLANMSHEIRTPINAITGMVHLIRKSGASPEQADRLDKIDVAGRHLLEIINTILDLSKIEAGKFVLEETVVSVTGIIDTVASMLVERAEAKSIRLITEVQQLPYPVLGDPTRLQQALLNYVSNAIKFTESGAVTINAKPVDETDEYVLVRFEVQDTGIGLGIEHAMKLFSAFEQADNSITRKYGGTGLGLTITKKFAQLMGGDAGVTSELGIGSTFWFTVLLKRCAHLSLAGTAPSTGAFVVPQKSDFSGKRVLLVEDEPVNREVVLAFLHDLGPAVDVALDGVEAVSMAEKTRYDLILMDMQMPRMDGLEATKKIREMLGGAAIPILALTANAFIEDKTRCHEAGMNDFLTKPVDARKLHDMLLHWLSAPLLPG